MAQQITKLDKAKAQIVLDQPFFASILLKRPLQETKAIKTIGVDPRGTIYYNPDWIESLTVPEIVFALAHEVMHVVGQHANRVGARDKKKWNHAADAWVNDVLEDAKLGTFIEGGVRIKDSKDKTVDEIYNLLPVEPPQPKNGKGKGQGGQGSGADPMGDDLMEGEGGPMSEDERKTIEAEMKVEVAQAAQAAKMRGNLPANIARMVEEMLNVKTPWFDILERFMVNLTKNENSWKRPNRKFIAHNIYLPSLNSIGCMGEMVIGVDTSGSIGQHELNAFAGHVNRIIEMCNPEKVTVIYCDAAINHVDEFEPNDYPVKLNPHGGGGTDLTQIFKHIEKKHLDPACCVIFTDGYTPFPDHVDFPTIWTMTTEVEAPAAAGETIHFELPRD
jgi:predicted metal-dependent peptidase